MSERRTKRETAKLLMWLKIHPGWAIFHRRTHQTWYVDQMDTVPGSLFRAMRRKKPGSILVLSPQKRTARSRLN